MKNKKICILVLTLIQIFLLHPLSCLDLNLSSSAELTASNGLTLLAVSPSVTMHNPSLFYQGISTATTNLYSYPELFLHHFSAGKQMFNWGITLGCNYIDHLSYREITTNFAVARKIKQFGLGMNLRYLFNEVTGYHRSGKIILDPAFSWRSEKTITTCVYKNLLHQKMLGSNLPTYLIWEAKFSIQQEVALCLGLEKQDKEGFIFKLGTRCQVQKFLTLILSCQYDPARLGAGLIFQISNLKISYGIRTHRYLPYTHSLGLTYEISKN